MTASMNAVRFFGSFNFLTPRTSGQLSRYPLSLSALRSRPSHGTAFAYGSVMLDKTERMNTKDRELPVIPPTDFKAEVLESEQPVLVAFCAPWSRPCQVLDSVLQQVSSACAGNVKIVNVNADDSLDLSLWYDIQSVPTLLYFVRGNPCVRIVGTASTDAILAKLKPFSR